MTKKKTIPQRLNEIEATVDKIHKEVYAMSRTMAIANDAVKTSEPRPYPEPPFWGWFKSAHPEETFRRLLRVTGSCSDNFYSIDSENSTDEPSDGDEPNWRKDLLTCLATEQEIKSHLITEAKKRYKVGDKIALHNMSAVFGSITKFTYLVEMDRLYVVHSNGGCDIYYAGKWAEIVKPKPIYVPIEICLLKMLFNKTALLWDSKLLAMDKDSWLVRSYCVGDNNTGANFHILSEEEFFIKVGDLVYFGIDRHSETSRKDIYNYGFYLGDNKVVHITGKTVEWDYEPKNQIRKVERV